MAKYNFNLREAQSKIDNPTETPIYLIIRWDNKRLVYPTGETVNPKYWQTDKKKSDFQRATNPKKFKDHAELNSRLDDIEGTAKDLFRMYVNDYKKQPSVEVLRKLIDKDLDLTKEVPYSFFDFFRKFIDESKIKTNLKTGSLISANTIKNYNNTFNHLKEFARVKRKRIDFDTIDLDFYHDFNDYLTKTKQHSVNTIGGLVKVIKTVLNEATERGVNTNLSFRSKRFQVITQKTDNVYLTETELNELYHLDLSHNQRLERVRDLFLIGCYTGLRFSDFSMLRPENIKGGYIEIETQKTGERVVIPLDSKIEVILKKYKNQLPPSVSNQKTNQYLKELANDKDKLKSLQTVISIKTTKGGLTMHTNYKKYELISSHTARRSFATNAYLRDTPPLIIMGITGHKTEKSFFQYIKLSSKEKAKIFEMYMNKHNNLKAV